MNNTVAVKYNTMLKKKTRDKNGKNLANLANLEKVLH